MNIGLRFLFHGGRGGRRLTIRWERMRIPTFRGSLFLFFEGREWWGGWVLDLWGWKGFLMRIVVRKPRGIVQIISTGGVFAFDLKYSVQWAVGSWGTNNRFQMMTISAVRECAESK
jgi:hypothetical protein